MLKLSDEDIVRNRGNSEVSAVVMIKPQDPPTITLLMGTQYHSTLPQIPSHKYPPTNTLPRIPS